MRGKPCQECGTVFYRRPRNSARQWEDRQFCCMACANKQKKTIAPHLSFWKYTEVCGPDDCWPWIGPVDEHGYGRISFMVEKVKAHRVAFEMFNGPIPDGLVIRHKCDNANCVNPRHLEAGTQGDNMKDASKRGRLNPKSLLNLHPGAPGHYGAGPTSRKEP